MEQNLQNLQLPVSTYMENNTQLLPQKQQWSGVYLVIYRNYSSTSYDPI